MRPLSQEEIRHVAGGYKTIEIPPGEFKSVHVNEDGAFVIVDKNENYHTFDSSEDSEGNLTLKVDGHEFTFEINYDDWGNPQSFSTYLDGEYCETTFVSAEYLPDEPPFQGDPDYTFT